MASVGNVKKLVWEKETPVRRGQNPRFFRQRKVLHWRNQPRNNI